MQPKVISVMTAKKDTTFGHSVIAKRRCLYLFLILVMFVIAANIGITALLLYYINISKHSIGEIRLESSRTIVNGNLLLEKSLVSETIGSHNGTLQLIGSTAIQFEAGDSAMVLDDDTLIVKAASLKINDDNGDEVFFVSPKETRTQFRALSLKGKAQALKSLQTKQIFSATNMKIASPTKKLLMSSAQDLTLKTGIGKVNVEALKDLDFEASKIIVGSKNVYLPKLKGFSHSSSTEMGTKNGTQVFEICVCNDGSIFAADIHQGCMDFARASPTIC